MQTKTFRIGSEVIEVPLSQREIDALAAPKPVAVPEEPAPKPTRRRTRAKKAE